METEQISAFAAYLQSEPPLEPETGASALDDSFSKLNKSEMIARLISNKKQALKRKNVPSGEPVQTKKQRKKKAGSKSAPVSQNSSLSPKEDSEDTIKKVTSKSVTDVKIAASTSLTVPEKVTKNGQASEANTVEVNKSKKKSAAKKAASHINGSPDKLVPSDKVPAKHPFQLKIHPKNPLELTFFTSSTNKKNAQANQKSHPTKTTTLDPNQTADFVNVVQSTPKQPSLDISPNGSSSKKKKSKNSSLAVETLRKSFVRSATNISSEEVPVSEVDVKQEQPSYIDNTLLPTENGQCGVADTELDMVSSIDRAKDLLTWIIDPTPLETFMETAWEKTPLLIARKCPTYYQDLLSTAGFDRMLREQRVEFTKNLDITSYVDGVRTTHNPEGRAMPPTVWDFYASGCSIRLLNPQTFLPEIHSMNATLQEYFQCMTGSNVYLTPANSQGFAPHYDDIEAFVLQIEGKKQWKVYKPRSVNEQLPRESSPNFSQSEIGEPIMDVILEAGDLLYFPRGFIHQATTVPGYHSLHITLSAYQKISFGDLLEQLIPSMLQSSIAENVLLRQGLPLNIWQCMGLVNSDDESRERLAILKKIKACLDLTMKSMAEHVDDAVDKLAARFQHDALPPFMSAQETVRSVVGTAATISATGDVDQPLVELETPLRLIRANVLRLVRHTADEFRIYYHTDNSKEYHQYEQTFAEISSEHAPAVEYLIKAYPEFAQPKDLPIENDEQCLAVAQDLWERGVLVTKDVLQ